MAVRPANEYALDFQSRLLPLHLCHRSLMTPSPMGLTVLVEEMPDVRYASFAFLIPAGAIYEPPGPTGLLRHWPMDYAGSWDAES